MNEGEDDDITPKEAEWQGNDIDMISRSPLKGSMELVLDDDSTVKLILDRETAEDLMSALVQFLGEGEEPQGPLPATH